MRVWFRENVTWVLGIVPLVYASIRIVLVSQGDRATIATLLSNLNILSLILGTILPVITTAIFYASAAGVSVCLKGFKSKDAVKTTSSLYGMVVSLALLVIAIGLSSPIVAGVLIGGLLLTGLLTWLFSGRKSTQFLDPRVALVSAIMTSTLPIVSSSMWLPAELLVQTQDRTGSVVYVISSDEDAITVLEINQGVKRIPLGQVKSRTLCNVEESDPSLIAMINDDITLTPLCDSLILPDAKN